MVMLHIILNGIKRRTTNMQPKSLSKHTSLTPRMLQGLNFFFLKEIMSHIKLQEMEHKTIRKYILSCANTFDLSVEL